MNFLPFAAVAPTQKIRVDRFPMRKILAQSSPLTPCFDYIKNGVDHLTDVDRARTSHFSLSNKIFEQFPLLITQVARISVYSHNQSIVQIEGM